MDVFIRKVTRFNPLSAASRHGVPDIKIDADILRIEIFHQ